MMQNGNIYSQALMKFGLTSLQATIYTTLVDLGNAGILKISRASKIARPEVYRVIPSLEEKGLVERVISNPSSYRAVPLKQGLSMLLQQKTQENTELLEETKVLLNSLPERSPSQIEKDTTQFVITTEIKLFLKRLHNAIQCSKKSIDFVTISRGLLDNVQALKRALEKGTKIRVILKIETENQSIQETIENLKKPPISSSNIHRIRSFAC